MKEGGRERREEERGEGGRERREREGGRKGEREGEEGGRERGTNKVLLLHAAGFRVRVLLLEVLERLAEALDGHLRVPNPDQLQNGIVDEDVLTLCEVT